MSRVTVRIVAEVVAEIDLGKGETVEGLVNQGVVDIYLHHPDSTDKIDLGADTWKIEHVH